MRPEEREIRQSPALVCTMHHPIPIRSQKQSPAIKQGKGHLLADQENVDSAEVELIVKRECCQSIVGWVHACIQHDRLPFVLNDVT